MMMAAQAEAQRRQARRPAGGTAINRSAPGARRERVEAEPLEDDEIAAARLTARALARRRLEEAQT
jgi:hypothetical protein